jgi:hypothetical protein
MEPKTLQDEFLAFRAAIENGSEPKSLASAFGAGVKAAIAVLTDPYVCNLCADKIEEVEQAATNFTPKKVRGEERERR